MKRVFFLCLLIAKPLLFASSIVIGIAGASGSGKTTLANKLKERLGDQVVIIAQDSYYRDLSHLTITERAKTNFDAPSSIDFELFFSHLIELKNGHSIQKPVYDFTIHSRTEQKVKIDPKPVIIIEGCLLFAVPKIRELCDMKLYIDVDMDVCLCRRIERDQLERGRKFHHIRDQYFSTVRPMFLKYVAPSRSYADLIIPNETKDATVLDFITSLLSRVINPSLTLQTIQGTNDV